MSFQIDFVVSWVDSHDRDWLERKNAQLIKMGRTPLMADEERYYEFGFFKYWFRALEKYAPWVNHVYLVTDHQTPSFFQESKKVTLVNHEQFIPSRYLPTFSSSVIELYLDRIPNISEHFVYFNDDMFLNASVSPDDFFTSDGMPKDMAVPSVLQPVSEFEHLPFNNSLVLNRSFSKRDIVRKYFGKFFSPKYGIANLIKSLMTLPFSNWSTFKIQHIPYSLRRADYELLRKYASDEIDRTSNMHFRSDYDINIWLLQEIRFMRGEFVPRSARDGLYLNFDNQKEILSSINTSNVKMLCINDASDSLKLENKIQISDKIIDAFEHKYPQLSGSEHMA